MTWRWFLLLALMPAWASGLDRLTFITEEYPPYNYERNGQLQGLSVNVLAAILEEHGATQTVNEVRLLPWARGYETVLTEPNTVLFSTTRTEAREDLFYWVGPIAPDRVSLIARRNSDLEIGSMAELKESDLKIAVIRQDIGAQRLHEAGVDPVLLRTAMTNDSALHMLALGRVDLWAYGEEVAYWLMDEYGFNREQFEPVYTISEAELYFAINRDTPQELVDAMQLTIEQFHQTGRMSELLRP